MIQDILFPWRAKRKRALLKWGKTVPLTNRQRKALQELWRWAQEEQAPDENPLACLSLDDITYLARICHPRFRPIRFGKLKPDVREAHILFHMEQQGMDRLQAELTFGIEFNKVGGISE